MRATYEAHVARSCARRAFEPSVPAGGPRRGGQGQVPAPRRRGPGASGCSTTRARPSGRHRQRATRQRSPSGRSASPAPTGPRCASTSCGTTASAATWPTPPSSASGLPGGPTGRRGGSVARPLDRRLAGRARVSPTTTTAGPIDLYLPPDQREVLTADRRDIPRWRTTWLHQWLTANAARYDFHPYLKEPWHWEHRPGSASATLTLRPRRRPSRDAGAEGRQLIAAGPGAAAYWREPAAIRARREHRRAAHRRPGRFPGHPAGHRVGREQRPTSSTCSAGGRIPG